MFGIGMPEMILILAVALIVIGPKKLPDLAKSLGKALGEFRKATRELKDAIALDEELDDVSRQLKDSPQEEISRLEKKRRDFQADIESCLLQQGSLALVPHGTGHCVRSQTAVRYTGRAGQ